MSKYTDLPESEKEKKRQNCKDWYQKNKKHLLKERKVYFNNNKEKILKHKKEYFNKNKTKIMGYQKEYYSSPNVRARYNSRRDVKKKALIDYKGGKCEICGYNKCMAVLVFHHRDEKKKSFNISQKVGQKLSNLKKEADKCMLLCANCHRELHWKKSQKLREDKK